MKHSTLVFDCDGVLVNSEEIVQGLELELLAELGLHYDRDEFSRRFLGTSDAHFLAGLSADAMERLGRPLPSSFPNMLKQRAVEAFSAQLHAFDGVTDLILSWPGQVAVASSSSLPALQYKLELTGILHYFGEHIYSADHVHAGKPDPAIYHHSAERLEVAPMDCIVIEDSVNGVLAAKAAGMHTIGFVGGLHCRDGHDELLLEAGADTVMTSMAEIKDHLT